MEWVWHMMRGRSYTHGMGVTYNEREGLYTWNGCGNVPMGTCLYSWNMHGKVVRGGACGGCDEVE